MSFRKPYDVLHEAAGAYVSGIFVPGAKSVSSIMASIQPVTEQDMVTPPEGRRLSDMVKIYTDSDLQEAEESTGLQPDLIVWRGYAYEINAKSVRQMDVINHYKVFATRRMAAPTGYAAAWVAGTLLRG